eukprot:1185177-Prorocentrum_minimum.AAC.7
MPHRTTLPTSMLHGRVESLVPAYAVKLGHFCITQQQKRTSSNAIGDGQARQSTPTQQARDSPVFPFRTVTCEPKTEPAYGRRSRPFWIVGGEILTSRRLDPLTTLGLCVRVCACVTAQWTGIVTQIAVDMLESGKVDAVVCVQSDENDRFTPKPVVARTAADIVAAKGVKPSLSPNLNVLATIEALVDVKKLLFIGVG